jgi:hypothetical protein
MLYVCNHCKKRLYIEEEFIDHMKNVHMNMINDARVVKNELTALDNDLKKVHQQGDVIVMEAARSATEERKVKWR